MGKTESCGGYIVCPALCCGQTGEELLELLGGCLAHEAARCARCGVCEEGRERRSRVLDRALNQTRQLNCQRLDQRRIALADPLRRGHLLKLPCMHGAQAALGCECELCRGVRGERVLPLREERKKCLPLCRTDRTGPHARVCLPTARPASWRSARGNRLIYDARISGCRPCRIVHGR